MKALQVPCLRPDVVADELAKLVQLVLTENEFLSTVVDHRGDCSVSFAGKLLAILEIANSVEAVQDGRTHIETINDPFLFREKGTPADRPRRASTHESGTFVHFTQAGADLFDWFRIFTDVANLPACSNRHSILAFPPAAPRFRPGKIGSTRLSTTDID